MNLTSGPARPGVPMRATATLKPGANGAGMHRCLIQIKAESARLPHPFSP